MENDRSELASSDTWILDRFTGGESDDRQPDPKMTITDRVERFMAAEYELGRAEIALEEGVNKIENPGVGYEDIQDAINSFRASAEYHASLVDEQELKQAVEAEDVRDYEAAAVLSRKEQMSARQEGVEMNEAYYKDLENRAQDFEEDYSDTQELGQDRDDGQTR